MSDPFLFKNFDIIFNSHDNIQRLNEMILTLAVQGKLVPQDPNDEPAEELLKKIQKEKEKLVAKGKIKKQKELLPIFEDEIPYELPKGWEWVRLGIVSKNIHYGYTASADHHNKDVKLLRITDIQNNTVDWYNVPGCIISDKDLLSYKLENSDILIARTGGTIGKSYLVKKIDFKTVFASYLIRVIPSSHIYDYYLKYTLESQLYWNQLYEKSKGTGQPNVNATSLSQLKIPIPPLKEQKRIVERIESLQQKVKVIEESFLNKDKYHIALNSSILNKVSNSENDVEFKEATKLLSDNFDLLYSDVRNVKELRQAILQLAVQGKLVHQDPNDEPAVDLLKKIQAEKEKLIAEGKIKKQKPLPPIKEDEIPFGLPVGWEWCRLGEVIKSIIGGGTPSKNISTYWNGDIPWASVKDLNDNIFLRSTIDSITNEGLVNSSSNVIIKNNIIICTRMGLGKIMLNEIDVAINQDLKGIILPDFINIFYFYYYYKGLEISGHGMTVKGLRQEVLVKMLFPLPPLKEQKRIVEKVDKLMKLCDNLEQTIEQSKKDSEILMQAVLQGEFIA